MLAPSFKEPNLLLNYDPQFINEVSGSNLRVSNDGQSCTSQVQLSETFELGDRSIRLIDAPALDNTNKTDAEVLADIALWLGNLYVFSCESVLS